MNLTQIKTRLASSVGADGTITDVLDALIESTAQAYSQIDQMGGTVPAQKNIDNFASAIETIESAEEVL